MLCWSRSDYTKQGKLAGAGRNRIKEGWSSRMSPASAINPQHDLAGAVTGMETVRVAVAVPVADAYDYGVGSLGPLSRGTVVWVPFGPRQVAGIVLGPGQADVNPARLKMISACAPVPICAPAFVDFIERVAVWNFARLGGVVKMVLSQPKALAPPPQQKLLRAVTPLPADANVTKTRQRVLDQLAGGMAMISADLQREAGVSPAVISAMISAGMVHADLVSADARPPQPDITKSGPTLTDDQSTAATIFCQSIGTGFTPYLLDGVTGSGKTEVYFEAVSRALAAGQQVLILLPEIALSAAWRMRFTQRFGCAPVEWHSDIGIGQKRRAWRAAADGQAQVVVGARSALFLPFANLGLIVVDEEHEHAFKQEEQVIYQARDMAVMRAQIEDCPIILASATPSLESWVNAGETGERQRYERVILPKRVKNAQLPEIKAVDMRQTPPERGRWLAPPLVEAITDRLERGEQTLLYLNRRGYAPLTLCGGCGHKVTCPNCDSWMVAHRLAGRLRCHHCGHETRPKDACSACGQTDTMQACGPGVERVAEEVLMRFPDASFAVLSSDTIGTPKAADAFIRSVIDGDVDIIIGTQMAAKGHHFPNLTLVGVVDADLGLAGGDLRAAERTFQILAQVAGRAGRESRPGTAMLQTLEAENPVLQTLLTGNRDAFLAQEAEARQLAGMPPYGRLAAIILTADSEERLFAGMKLLAQTRPYFQNVDIFGPAPAPLSFLKGRHRGRFLVRTTKVVNIQAILHGWLDEIKLPAGVKMQVDIDPYNFL